MGNRKSLLQGGGGFILWLEGWRGNGRQRMLCQPNLPQQRKWQQMERPNETKWSFFTVVVCCQPCYGRCQVKLRSYIENHKRENTLLCFVLFIWLFIHPSIYSSVRPIVHSFLSSSLNFSAPLVDHSVFCPIVN